MGCAGPVEGANGGSPLRYKRLPHEELRMFSRWSRGGHADGYDVEAVVFLVADG